MFSKLTESFKNSRNGLKLAWADDQSFRNTCWQAALGTIIATVIAVTRHADDFMWLLMVASLFPMVIIEMVNSSIEAVTDKASPEKHPLAKKAKDMGSAAVLLSRILAILCWSVALCAIYRGPY